MSDKTEMVSMTRYSCFSGFHGAASGAISSFMVSEVVEGSFSCPVGGVMSNR